MAKRFLDSELFRKEWFRKLSPKLKCALIYILLEADEVGLISIESETIKFHVGQKVDTNEIIESVNKSDSIRLIPLEKSEFLIEGFILFQYKNLSLSCPPHKPIIEGIKKLLTRYPNLNLSKAFPKGFQNLQEIEKEEEKEKVKELEKKKEKEKARLKKEIEKFKKEFPEDYPEVQS